ncbi:adenosylhomocysteine nucleosidase [Micromonospora phaseoli]|uniref:Adenosylhomocysteine nucleosidase n=1 Tax=Micromonospora phaseoli TaxID=1144548 RepID=A0A1H6VS86_9ACTN|nr:nucleosidase [Micromonospora phaseoli]PZV93592.1 adenosylhomocysteine nucleosidase [Micromonospora phaseoli]GIJ80221.1 nucleosidase [Micromonospora phaseoli]SEJ02885.1 adenosylhomocysteine nucleosidase [Micromonospora phaseoli]
MDLRGTISPDRPLLVLAIAEEAAYLDPDLPVLLTGMGKVNAAAAVAVTLAHSPLPSAVINLGTAGALHPGWAGIHEVGSVLQHDLDTEFIRRLTGQTVGAPLALGDGPTLATGDQFIADDDVRAALAQRAQLVDMEGYAVASTARRFGVPVRLIKQVSDEAGAGAERTWKESVDACARLLAGWVRDQL